MVIWIRTVDVSRFTNLKTLDLTSPARDLKEQMDQFKRILSSVHPDHRLEQLCLHCTILVNQDLDPDGGEASKDLESLNGLLALPPFNNLRRVYLSCHAVSLSPSHPEEAPSNPLWASTTLRSRPRQTLGNRRAVDEGPFTVFTGEPGLDSSLTPSVKPPSMLDELQGAFKLRIRNHLQQLYARGILDISVTCV